MISRAASNLRKFLDAEVDRAFYETFQVTQSEVGSWRDPPMHRVTVSRIMDGSLLSGRRHGLPTRRVARRPGGRIAPRVGRPGIGLRGDS